MPKNRKRKISNPLPTRSLFEEHTILKTMWINFGIYGGTLLGTMLGLLASPIIYACLRATEKYTSAEAVRKLIWIYGRCWVTLVSLFIPVTFPKGDIPSPCVIVANHASFFDVYFMGAQPVWNSAIAVRQWPFNIPFYKPFMIAAEYVRTENSTPEQVVADSLQTIENGASLIFFPEGSRSRDGKLQRFYSGAFKAAVMANVPVVPLCLSGTGDFLSRGSWILKDANITLSLLHPIYPANFSEAPNPHVALRKEVKTRMAEAMKTTADF